MTKNRLLIVLTTYSRGYNLPAIVDSIVNQTFKDYKILICDDLSPNNPADICKDIIKKYPHVNIEYHRNSINIREGMNINRAIGKEFENGFEYIVVFQDDTIYIDNNFLFDGISLLDQNADVEYCGGIISSAGRPSSTLFAGRKLDYLKINGIDFWRNWGRVPIHWVSCIFRFIDFARYRFSYTPRKDVFNGDSLLLLHLAMQNNIIVYNKPSVDIAYNKQGGGMVKLSKIQ